MPPMNLRRLFLFVLLPLSLSGGCSRTEPPLRVAAIQWPGYESLFLAQREGWFDGRAIEIIEKGSATQMLAALKSAEVVAATLTLDEVLRAREQGIPLQVVMVFDESAGADLLISKQPLSTLDELRGLRIGVEQSGVGALLLLKVLELAGLAEQDVVVVDTPIDQQLASWDGGRIDVMISFNPVASQLERRGGNRLFDSSLTPNLIVDVLAVRADMVESHRMQLQQLVAAHFRVLRRMRIHQQDTAYRMAAHLGLTGREVLMAFRGMRLPDLAVNRRYLARDGDITRAADAIANIMLSGRLLSRQAELTDLVSSDYLPVE